MMELKSLPFDVKAEAEGVIVGYGSVFGNADHGGDVIEPGAFSASLVKRMPKMLWQHDMAEPIGRWTEATEDGKGLVMRGRISTGTTRGRDAYELVKDGAIDGLSIGYRVMPNGSEMDGNIRRIKSVELFEVSVVSIPMNDRTRILGVKADMTERDFERFLLDAGLSRKAAKAFVADGWKGYREHLRDAGNAGPEDNLRDADDLKRNLEQLIRALGVKQ